MTTPGLLAPPRAARPRVNPPEIQPPPTPPPDPKPRPSFERIFAWSIAASILLHLLVLLLSPLFIVVGVPPGAAASSASSEPSPSFGMEVIVAVPSADAPDLPVPETREEQPVPPQPVAAQPAPQRPEAGPSDTPAAAGQGDPPRVPASDALRPGFRDPRLYVAPRQFPNLEKTEHERYMEHLQARIDAVNDSMNIASNRERTTSDWTTTDRSGNTWGIDDDGLHLGPITIPDEILPNIRSTGDNQQIQDRREQQRQRDEIRRQEEDRARRERQEEAIRSAREAQEGQRSGGGDGS